VVQLVKLCVNKKDVYARDIHIENINVDKVYKQLFFRVWIIDIDK